MTTILADYKLGLMVTDSSINDGDRAWSGRKVFRVKGALVGMAGDDSNCTKFLEWYRGGLEGPIDMGEASALILTSRGLFLFDANYEKPRRLELGREAIGTGAKAAMCAYEALGFTDPRKVVRIVCKHDASSRAPVRSYNLKAITT